MLNIHLEVVLQVLAYSWQVMHGIDSTRKLEGFSFERADLFADEVMDQLEKIDQGRFVWYIGDPRKRGVR
jgi:hypothetical protein